VSNFIQTAAINGRRLVLIERCRKATGLSIQLFGRNPYGCHNVAPKHVGRKETSCSYLNSSKESHSRVSLNVESFL
jgi:hypothetical protein